MAHSRVLRAGCAAVFSSTACTMDPGGDGMGTGGMLEQAGVMMGKMGWCEAMGVAFLFCFLKNRKRVSCRGRCRPPHSPSPCASTTAATAV